MKTQKRKYSLWQIVIKQLKAIHAGKRDSIYLLYLTNAICAGGLPVVVTFLPKIIIETLVGGGTEIDVVRSVLVVVGISFLLAIGVAIAKGVNNAVFMPLRFVEFKKFNAKFMEIDYAYMEDLSFRDRVRIALTTLSSDFDGFEGAYRGLFDLFPLLLSVGLYALLIGWFQPVIFLASVLGTVVSFIVKSQSNKYVLKRKNDEARTARKKDYFYEVGYDFSYGKEIRLFDMEASLSQKYKKRSSEFIRVHEDMQNNRFRWGLWELVALLLQDAVAFYLILRGFYDGALSLGEVALYIGAVLALSTSLRLLTETLSLLNLNTRLTSDYYEFMEDGSFFSAKGNRKAFDSGIPVEIEFRNVSFKYPKTDQYIFKNFSFVIPKGEKLAVVGINGAGKSTLVKLITRMFDISEGTILLNGVDTREFDPQEFQRMFSVVFQDVNILAASVMENVIGGDPDEDARNRGIACLEQAGLKDKIASLPRQYDTPLLKVIEADGVEMSGGQNQKIAIARALYKDANMIILDEPTAALDALAEAAIYQSFADLVQGKTTIFISHRLSSTRFCDRIALFSPEGLQEYGTHDELMGMKGKYYDMFITQGKYYQNEVEAHA